MLAPLALANGGTTRTCLPLAGSPARALVPREKAWSGADQNGRPRSAARLSAGAVEP